MRTLALSLALALAGCATDDNTSGTGNPAVTTPAEAPVGLDGEPSEIPPDSATTLPSAPAPE